MLQTQSIVIRPTNTCFDDALDFVEHVARSLQLSPAEQRRRLDCLVVVHGVCLSPVDNGPYAHAWVEETDEGGTVVWQAGIVRGLRMFYSLEVDDFVANARPQDMTRYTVGEAIQLNHQTDHYGPWEPRYVDLCRERSRG